MSPEAVQAYSRLAVWQMQRAIARELKAGPNKTVPTADEFKHQWKPECNLVCWDSPAEHLWMIRFTGTTVPMPMREDYFLLRLYLQEDHDQFQPASVPLRQRYESEIATWSFLTSRGREPIGLQIPIPQYYLDGWALDNHRISDIPISDEQKKLEDRLRKTGGPSLLLGFTIFNVPYAPNTLRILSDRNMSNLIKAKIRDRKVDQLDQLVRAIVGYQKELMRLSCSGMMPNGTLESTIGFGNLIPSLSAFAPLALDSYRATEFHGDLFSPPTLGEPIFSDWPPVPTLKANDMEHIKTVEEWLEVRLESSVNLLESRLDMMERSRKYCKDSQDAWLKLTKKRELAGEIRKLLSAFRLTDKRWDKSVVETLLDRETLFSTPPYCPILQPACGWGSGTILYDIGKDQKLRIISVANWYGASFVPAWRVMHPPMILLGPRIFRCEFGGPHSPGYQLLRDQAAYQIEERLIMDEVKSEMRESYTEGIYRDYDFNQVIIRATGVDVLRYDLDVLTQICEPEESNGYRSSGLLCSPGVKKLINERLLLWRQILEGKDEGAFVKGKISVVPLEHFCWSKQFYQIHKDGTPVYLAQRENEREVPEVLRRGETRKTAGLVKPGGCGWTGR
ncbi:hypothetical protein BJ508DRAFT_365573 [Ascobolus immersus RN42]|uniref:Uncharacterized protein n=1 Tax=Ascobolus immersus RN42 TaxID=1160509 RepID=A0A3N4HP99_ASCIM|nr:hypothetical protein BJ508DRAFT_365573 [Ascobolus immersus RN42]